MLLVADTKTSTNIVVNRKQYAHHHRWRVHTMARRQYRLGGHHVKCASYKHSTAQHTHTHCQPCVVFFTRNFTYVLLHCCIHCLAVYSHTHTHTNMHYASMQLRYMCITSASADAIVCVRAVRASKEGGLANTFIVCLLVVTYRSKPNTVHKILNKRNTRDSFVKTKRSSVKRKKKILKSPVRVCRKSTGQKRRNSVVVSHKVLANSSSFVIYILRQIHQKPTHIISRCCGFVVSAKQHH